MLFNNIIGQQEIKQQLDEMLQHNRLSQALLFLGKEGSGALPLALAFAQFVVCEKVNGQQSIVNGPSLFGDEPVSSNHQPATDPRDRLSEAMHEPMGRLDAVDVGAKKLTVQTEFFRNPAGRIETKVYLGGALKKVYTDDVDADDPELQKRIDAFHQAKIAEIMEGLRARKA